MNISGYDFHAEAPVVTISGAWSGPSLLISLFHYSFDPEWLAQPRHVTVEIHMG